MILLYITIHILLKIYIFNKKIIFILIRYELNLVYII